MRRHLQDEPELLHVVRNCWRACVIDGVHAPGPVGIVYKHVLKIGWAWPVFDEFHRIGRRNLPLVGGPDAWWKHELREGIRLALWSDAAARRQDMEGLQEVQGIDRKATMSLHGSKLPPKALGLLRGVLAGSTRLQKRLHDAALVLCPTCPFCGLCDESLRHCFWDCPRWDSIRNSFKLPCIDVRNFWPACTLDCGIFVEDARVLDLAAQLEQEETEAKDIVKYFGCHDCRSGVAASHDVNEQQRLWTDGAASNNQDCRFRRAGFGIYYGECHDMNLGALLPGLQQTNQRAELLAVVVACLRDPRPLDIRSDSDYVCTGLGTWRSWVHAGWSGDHADLWDALAAELLSRSSPVQVMWVKGHAKPIDILRGRTTEEDKRGNDGADALAVAGAKMHPISSEVLEAAVQRREYAVQVQSMMVTVLEARFEAEDGIANVSRNADRGSECDCTEFLDDEFGAGAPIADMGDGIGPLDVQCSDCIDCVDCIEAPGKHVFLADDGCPGNGTCPATSVLSSLCTSDCADCIGPLDDAIVTGPGIVTDTEPRVGADSDTEHSFAVLTCTNTLHDGLTSLETVS